MSVQCLIAGCPTPAARGWRKAAALCARTALADSGYVKHGTPATRMRNLHGQYTWAMR